MQGLTDLRRLIAALEGTDDLLRIDRPASPIREMPALARATDGGPVVLFEKVAGYPGVRGISNIFSDKGRIARLCGVEPDYLPGHLADAARRPLAPVEVATPPCQEVVHREDLDVARDVPVTQQTEGDAGLILTGSLALVRDPQSGEFNGSYHRMRVLGADSCAITIQAGRHLLEIARKFRARGETKVPLTVNIGCNPATLLACSGSTQQTLTPLGYDELGLAGALQGQAVEVAPALTQPGAWAVADAEYVLEGHIDTTEFVFEEDSGEDGRKPFMPEAGGYMGRAWKVWKFEVTAISHRRDPIYWLPLAPNLETLNLMAMTAEASIFDICRRISPRSFDTCNVLPGMRGCLGVVVRINRKSFRDEGVQNNLMLGALSGHTDLGWAIVVDRDIDITCADEVLWAMITRAHFPDDLMVTPRAKVSGMLAEGDAAGTGRKVGVDATAAFQHRDRYARAAYDPVDLGDWMSAEAAARVVARQSPYIRSLNRRGY